jgi:serine/threonine protein kinase
LRDAVEALFLADEAAERAGDSAASEVAGRWISTTLTEAVFPQEIGPYRILGVLGRGGMGVAYLAQQSNPDRQVALKVLRSGVRSSGIRVRFAREIRVLGRLAHPGIASIFESGTAESGNEPISYYAMEYVAGPNILDYAKAHALDLATRLELVARFADAVQHAHTKGVVHRDLKPANILVRGVAPDKEASGQGSTGTSLLTAGPHPVILDFGIARILDGDDDATRLTEAGLLIGTVGYMSVEQLNGDIDARADVYSIGVILYELLTGRMPHELRGKPVPEAARIVRDEEPAPLNSRDNTVAGFYDRDIVTIVGRAIAKNREDRYQTAASLAEDIRRYLNHEPILARPATTLYHMSKFARRHRGLVAGAVSAVLMLAIGLGASLAFSAKADVQRSHAEEERRIAIEQRERADRTEKMSTAVRNYLLDDVLMAVSPERLGTSATLIDVMLNARKEIGPRFVGQPEVEAEVRMTLARVLVSAGREKEGAEESAAAVALLEGALGPDDEKTIDAVLRQAEARNGAMTAKERIRLTEDAVERIKRAHQRCRCLRPSPSQRRQLRRLRTSRRSIVVRCVRERSPRRIGHQELHDRPPPRPREQVPHALQHGEPRGAQRVLRHGAPRREWRSVDHPAGLLLLDQYRSPLLAHLDRRSRPDAPRRHRDRGQPVQDRRRRARRQGLLGGQGQTQRPFRRGLRRTRGTPEG